MTPAQAKIHFPEADPGTLEMALALLRDFDALVSVRCRGMELRLPARNSLWRGLQFWGLVTGCITIDFSRFCLAGNCRQCAMTVTRPGGEPETILACRTEVEAGMELAALPEGFAFRGME